MSIEGLCFSSLALSHICHSLPCFLSLLSFSPARSSSSFSVRPAPNLISSPDEPKKFLIAPQLRQRYKMLYTHTHNVGVCLSVVGETCLSIGGRGKATSNSWVVATVSRSVQQQVHKWLVLSLGLCAPLQGFPPMNTGASTFHRHPNHAETRKRGLRYSVPPIRSTSDTKSENPSGAMYLEAAKFPPNTISWTSRRGFWMHKTQSECGGM